jgi:hypothetical protein
MQWREWCGDVYARVLRALALQMNSSEEFRLLPPRLVHLSKLGGHDSIARLLAAVYFDGWWRGLLHGMALGGVCVAVGVWVAL